VLRSIACRFLHFEIWYLGWLLNTKLFYWNLSNVNFRILKYGLCIFMLKWKSCGRILNRSVILWVVNTSTFLKLFDLERNIIYNKWLYLDMNLAVDIAKPWKFGNTKHYWHNSFMPSKPFYCKYFHNKNI
jgi:hypothetical protein